MTKTQIENELIQASTEFTERVLHSPKASLQKVDSFTRAGAQGKLIMCPYCRTVATVYHFSWSACTCQGFRKMVKKTDYLYLK